jgi:hypothetical protein
MAKRVSLKGKGADIFFGEYAATSDEPAQASPPASFSDGAAMPASEEQTPNPAPTKRARSNRPPTGQPTRAVVAEAVDQEVKRSLRRPINRPIDRVVDRPKAFYITESLDSRIDEAVRYLQTRHGLRKVDRSILVTTLLSDDALWTDTALDGLVDRLIGQLTSRLTR